MQRTTSQQNYDGTLQNPHQTYEFIPIDLDYLEKGLDEPLPDVVPVEDNSFEEENELSPIPSSPLNQHSNILKNDCMSLETRPTRVPDKEIIIPQRNPRESNTENLIELLMDKSDGNIDCGIRPLPFKTPVKHSVYGKENFLNCLQRPDSHSIRCHPMTNVLRIPNSSSSKKLFRTPILMGKKFTPTFKTSIESSNLPRPREPHTPIHPVSKTVNEKFTKLTVNGIEYIVIKVLGKGGSSVVYECLNNASKEKRAIKCVSLESSSSSAGYIQEIDVLKRLQQCDRIIRLYDYELLIQEKKLYVNLEMGSVDLGHILKDLSKNDKVPPSYLILFYWMEMLYAVQQIHSHGIIHSDLKPANFLQVNGRLKLIDFGISSCVQDDSTSVIKMVSEGTSNYISPEALNSEMNSNKGSPTCGKPKYKISFKADIWSLGCILYQLIYKRTPFQHLKSPMQKLLAIANPNFKIEYLNNHKVPKKFIETTKKCLIFNVKSRPSVDELISDFEQFCEM